MQQLVEKPLRLIQSLEPTSDISSHFKQALHGSWNSVPTFNLHNVENLKPDSLVRFRCMVQNIYDPEYYAEMLEEIDASGQKHIITSKYHEVVQSEPGTKIVFLENTCATRLPTICISIPGETEWVVQHYTSQETAFPQQSSQQAALNDSTNQGMKRNRDDNENDDGDVNMDERAQTLRLRQEQNDNNQNGAAAMPSTAPAAATSSSSASSCPAFLKVPNITTATVKFYDDIVEDIRLNETYDIIGILQLDPGNAFTESSSALDPAPTPTSVIPCIHAILVEKYSANTPCPQQPTNVNFGNLRAAAASALSRCLGNDQLAIEYCLMSLASRVYGRSDGMCIGKLSLNLSGFNQNLTDQLSRVLKSINPRFTSVSMDIATLNAKPFTPKKNYSTNDLVYSTLQLPNHTVVLLNETAMNPGTLLDNGVKNLQAITNVIVWQKLSYDFEFYPVDFLTDVVTIVCSEGKSILPADICVRHQPQGGLDTTEVDATALELARAFIGVAKQLEPTIDEQTKKLIEDDFVESRKSQGVITADNLHVMITLARLYAATFGEQLVTAERWKQVLQLEQHRQARLK